MRRRTITSSTDRHRDRWRRRRGIVRALTIVTALVAGVLVGPLALPGGAANLPLSASTFDGDDGNQIIDTLDGAGETDWVTFMPDTTDDDLFRAEDTPSGTGDNSLAGGTKDDTECPSITTGSIPNNKDDLLRFYLAHETITVGDDTNTFLYLGYVRALPGTTTASAHGVFELNQVDTKCPDFPAKGKEPATPSPFHVRTDGDVRIAFDDEGGDQPIISVQTWNEPCSGTVTAGCWGTKQALSGSQAVGEFNAVTITDELNTFDSDTSLSPERFGEAKINMNAAGLIDEGDCEGFGAASLYTGSSGNSDKEQSKDFIAPIPINLDFCEPVSVDVEKAFSGAAPTTNAVFDLYYDTDESGDRSLGDELLDTCTIEPGDVTDEDSDGTFEGTCAFADLEKGTAPFTTFGPHTIIVTESTVPDGFTGSADVIFTFTFDETAQSFTATFTNSPGPSDVDLKKEDDAGNPLSGAVFTLYTDDDGDGVFDDEDSEDPAPDTSTGRTCTTDAAGDCLEDGVTEPTHAFHALELGDYCVVETTVPDHHDAPAVASDCFTVGLNDSGDPIDLGAFENPRQHRIIVLVCHEGTNTLLASEVTLDGETKTSRATVVHDLTEEELCTIGGAQFEDISGHDQRDVDVTPANH